jgi:hypothetical protein
VRHGSVWPSPASAFGFFASPELSLPFDIHDFDESLR